MLFVNACYASLTLECLVDFLKFRNVNDDSFASAPAFAGDAGVCSDDVKNKILQFYANARTKMEVNFMQKPYIECALKNFQGELYENLLLKATAVELKGVGWRLWNTSQKNSRIKDLEKKAQDMVDAALIKCRGQIEYGTFFDSFYEQKRTEQFSDEFDFCMRKHLIDRNVINSNSYNFQANPKNLQTQSIDCVQIMKTALEQMKSQIAGAGSKCVIDIFLNNGYLDLLLKIQLLTKLNVTPLEKEVEKQVFIQQMINMTHSIRSCPQQ